MEFIDVATPIVGEEEVEAVREVLLSGKYVSGQKVEAFEKEFSSYIGVKEAVAVSSGTAALQLSLAGYEIGPGDEVIIPAMTFFSTATAVIHQNAIPIFADVDENYCIDPISIEKNISEKTKAIIPVHFLGYAANMKRIMEIAEKYNLVVIEDCAQAHGTIYYGRKVGSIGNCGTFSFFATKNMTTGEGGIITTDNKDLAEKVRILRNHGMINRDNHVMLGYNYRMTEIEAAIGSIQLKKLDNLNKIRIENSEYILNKLKDIEWLHIQKFDSSIKHTFFWCPIRLIEDKFGHSIEDFKAHLINNGIEFRQRYQSPLNMQQMFINKSFYPKGCPLSCSYYGKKIDYSKANLPNAEKYSGKIIGLPNHPKLGEKQIKYVIEVVRSAKKSI